MPNDSKVVKLFTDSTDRVNAFLEGLEAVKGDIEDVISVLKLKDRKGFVTVYTACLPEDFAVATCLLQKEFSEAMTMDDTDL